MNVIQKLKPWLGRKSVRGAIFIVLIILTILYLGLDNKDSTALPSPQKEIVRLTSAQKYAGDQTLSVIGSVRAVSEAKITSEASGRVVSVNVKLGDTVRAGTVIASLENASERAAVLQAEGVYEAALAAAEQSGISVDQANNSLNQAKNSAVSTYRSAYNTVNTTVRNSIDDFFANPDFSVPGLRIDGKGYTQTLNNERVAYKTLLTEWQTKSNTISANSDLISDLEEIKGLTNRTINFVDTFLTVFSLQNNDDEFQGQSFQTLISTFTNIQNTLISSQSSIDNAISALNSAEDSLKKAQLASSGGTTSAADAQVKQALGTLRSAQANLQKTIFTTPVSGTVNSLSVRTGDFINNFAEVAIVANNNAFEIITYVSDTEKSLLFVGDTVTIDGKIEGVVTQIAPAVDPITRKTEVRITTENADVTNGDTVRISKDLEIDTVSSAINIPLTAVKFDQENGSVFIVRDGKLVSKSVELGEILGGSVEVLEGLTFTEEFVLDARGLINDEEVEVIN